MCFLLFASSILLITSCDQKVKTSEEQEINDVGDFNIDGDFIKFENAQKMDEIEARLDPLKMIRSLVWEKQFDDHEGSELIQVEAYLNDDGAPIKITEHIIGVNYAPQGDRNFYLENNEVIAYQENLDVWIDSMQNHYVEKRTVYEDGKAVLTQTRFAPTYEEIDYEEWKEIPTEQQSIDKINRLLNGTDEFETHFISVIKGNNLFLLLGENKDQVTDRYTTAVRVDEMTPFIEDLLDNLEKYKFRPINIQFTVVGGNNEPEFRVLTDISWKN